MKRALEEGWELLSQGAEAKVWGLVLAGRPAVAKERAPKAYRHTELDAKLTPRRVLGEARCLLKCRRAGLDTPALLLVDLARHRLYMERIDGGTLKERLRALHLTHAANALGDPGTGSGVPGAYGAEGLVLARAVGSAIAKLHNADVAHGDLTTSNFMLRNHPTSPAAAESATSAPAPASGGGGVVLIDFGLAYAVTAHEDKAVDLYVLERAFLSTHAHAQPLLDEVP
jgi:TP53 regulating kinase-like protein